MSEVRNMQQLSVNLTIPIPSDSVLVSKVELQELKQQQLKGVYWSIRNAILNMYNNAWINMYKF
ncbi:DUF771 domain-containing protein, partial [Niallia circulans]|uniref:DUF771 domain-containing protein n=1 Tax=Niallia circulans TaxID=1397 RepID=UPI0034C60AEA